jgi:hypothetical protein
VRTTAPSFSRRFFTGAYSQQHFALPGSAEHFESHSHSQQQQHFFLISSGIFLTSFPLRIEDCLYVWAKFLYPLQRLMDLVARCSGANANSSFPQHETTRCWSSV